MPPLLLGSRDSTVLVVRFLGLKVGSKTIMAVCFRTTETGRAPGEIDRSELLFVLSQ